MARKTKAKSTKKEKLTKIEIYGDAAALKWRSLTRSEAKKIIDEGDNEFSLHMFPDDGEDGLTEDIRVIVNDKPIDFIVPNPIKQSSMIRLDKDKPWTYFSIDLSSGMRHFLVINGDFDPTKLVFDQICFRLPKRIGGNTYNIYVPTYDGEDFEWGEMDKATLYESIYSPKGKPYDY